jgi:hypothetical protein
MKTRPSVLKRQRELARQDRKAAKAARREQRKNEPTSDMEETVVRETPIKE